MEKIENPSGSITIPHNVYISRLVFDLYNEYNSSTPDPCIDITDLQEMTDIVCKKIGVEKKPYIFKSFRDYIFPLIPRDNTKTVVLGFSGGLDSVYQAIDLKERGYFVTLYHLKGINTYENGQATKRCREIAKKLGMPYVESVISKKRGAQSIPENPFKNELIMSLMIDYCLHWGIQYISMGDDLNLSINDSVVGVNVTDAREVTEAFMDGVKDYIDIKFLPIMGGEKIDRIKKLIEYGLEDDYYSCVQAGRFNKKLHDLNEKKYGIKLFDGNCGCSCRKCAMHNLLLHYSSIRIFPKDFIDKCWRVMWDNSHSADYELFRPDLPEKVRLNNLFTY